MTDSKTTSGGIGLPGLLGVAFIVLKLCHVIDWSWWWVLAPFWVPFLIFLFIAAGFGFVFVCVIAYSWMTK